MPAVPRGMSSGILPIVSGASFRSRCSNVRSRQANRTSALERSLILSKSKCLEWAFPQVNSRMVGS